MKKMKKFIAAFLLSAFILSVSSCAAFNDNQGDDTTTSGKDDSDITTAEVTTVSSKPGGHQTSPDTSVRGGVSSEERHITVSEDGITALEVSLSLPVVEVYENDAVQEQVNEKIKSITEEIYEYVDAVKMDYISAAKSGSSSLVIPSLSVGFTLNYFTSKAVSLTFTFTEINGYGNTSRSCQYYNFELDTYGAEITLDTLFSSRTSDNRAEVIRLIKERASQRADLFPDHNALIESLAQSSWYISGSRIIFRFDPYTLAPASVGFITFEFEAGELASLMSEYGRDLLDLS